MAAIKKQIDCLDDQAVLPKSDLADALRYIRNHWDALTLYATDGRIPIDNNRVAQLMREVALGRRNWLFVGNIEAGERSARLMSIVSSAKRHHLDVGLYVKNILDRLLAGETDYSKLVPDQWKSENSGRVKTHMPFAFTAKKRPATNRTGRNSTEPAESWPQNEKRP